MTLSDFATFSTAVSGLAVTASLIYRALQTHQNAKHTRVIHQGRMTAKREIVLATSDHDLAAAMIAVEGGTPTPEEIQRRQYRAIYLANFVGWQDTYAQYQNGLLDDDFFRAMRRTLERALGVPASRAVVESARMPGTRFTGFVDEIVASLPSAKP